MKPKVKISKLSALTDARGSVFEPLASDEIPEKQNVHVVTSHPGVIRGNHFHVMGEETIVVLGPVLVRYREDDVDRDVTVAEGEVFRFIFPPKVSHAIQNTSGRPNILVAFNTVPHDPDHPDTVKAVLIWS